MNQSELIEKVAQATELNQAAAGHAVKAVVNAILDALLAGDAVRVSGLGIFNVAARPAREGRSRGCSGYGSKVWVSSHRRCAASLAGSVRGKAANRSGPDLLQAHPPRRRSPASC